MESPETLLEHATWLCRLATGLVGDRTLADDVVQDTWVAALRSPPEPGHPVRPWLARVVRNAARFRWRSDANRAAREAATAGNRDAVTPTSEELLARHELQQLLAKLVGELDEPFRATILLRYAEGLEPTQIARRLSIPAGTVRWRIKEGLERLRIGLDTEHGGNRKAWLLALAPVYGSGSSSPSFRWSEWRRIRRPPTEDDKNSKGLSRLVTPVCDKHTEDAEPFGAVLEYRSGTLEFASYRYYKAFCELNNITRASTKRG